MFFRISSCLAARRHSTLHPLALVLLGAIVSFNTHATSTYVDVTLGLGVSEREASLRWNIASDASGSNTPNILSELTYDDLTIREIQGSANFLFHEGFLKNLHILIDFKTGTNQGGVVIDSDYHGDDRTDEYSRSESNPDDSTTIDGKLLVGYPLQWDEHVFFTPFIGYSYSRQYLRMRDGVQILDTRAASLPLGPFRSELNSKYKTDWHSLVMAIEGAYRRENHHIGLRWEFLITDYYAEANWNLRSDFAHPKSFAHWATGTGNNIELTYRYLASDVFSFWLSYRWEDWKTHEGDDVVYFSDGSKAGTQLNEVVWESTTTSAGFALSF